ncbi:MAG: DUF5667 domain-containing protein [bacterium]|nr:DUF5667 domain-containing protein [bacterium]
MKRIITIIFIIVFSFILTPAIHSATEPKTIIIEEKEIPYELPHPGLLPDHPLYFFKTLRDNILIMTTRNSYKKAKLYLHLSDKRITGALRLSEKGKDELALKNAAEAEEIFLEIPPFLKTVKEEGGEDSESLISALHLSNAKHREVISEMIENTTQTEIQVLEELLMKNEEGKKALNALQ